MESFLAIIGGFLILCISIGIVFITGSIFFDKIKSLLSQMNWRAEKNARKDIGLRIMLDSWRFSENEEVMLAMRELGTTMNNHYDGLYNINDVRESWREKIKQEIK